MRPRQSDQLFDPRPGAAHLNPIGFFEAIALEGAEGTWIRIPADTQRRFFGGAVPFGKRSVKVEADGLVRVWRSMDFGRDFEEDYLRFDHSTGLWLDSMGNASQHYNQRKATR